MIIAAALITLRMPDARSLKDKRQVLRGLLDKLRDRHNASVLEVGSLDEHQRAEVGAALVGRDRVDAERRMQRLALDVETITGLKYIDVKISFI